MGFQKKSNLIFEQHCHTFSPQRAQGFAQRTQRGAKNSIPCVPCVIFCVLCGKKFHTKSKCLCPDFPLSIRSKFIILYLFTRIEYAVCQIFMCCPVVATLGQCPNTAVGMVVGDAVAVVPAVELLATRIG